MANTLKFSRNGGVDFIDWLDDLVENCVEIPIERHTVDR